MEVDVEDAAVLVETIHHAVPVVQVDVDVGDPTEGAGQRGRDRDAQIVEDAEPGGRPPGGVVQTSRGLEGPPRSSGGDGVESPQRAADHAGGGVEAAGERRGVASIEELPVPPTVRGPHPGQVGRGVEPKELLVGRQRDLPHPSYPRRKSVRTVPLFEQARGEPPAPRIPRVGGPEIVLQEPGISHYGDARAGHVGGECAQR